MKVIKPIIAPEYPIEIGDVFSSSHGDKFYVLMDLPDSFALRNLEGKTHYMSDPSLDTVISSIRDYVAKGKLIHYPANKYQIQLIEILGESQ